MKKNLLLSAMFTVAAVAAAGAQPRIAVADSLRAYYNVGDCCMSTPLDACLKQKPHCKSAPRLASFLNWLDSLNRIGRVADTAMPKMLDLRYQSFAETRVTAIDTAGWPVAGDPRSPLTVVVYFAGTCPLCKNNFRELHREVTAGSLRGKAKMVSKPLSVNAVNTALMAAHGMGRFSDVMLRVAERGGRVDEAMIFSVAAGMMMDTASMRALTKDAEIARRALASENEAKKNDVRYVPTYYINGRRYQSVLDWQWVVDAIDYSHGEIKK